MAISYLCPLCIFLRVLCVFCLLELQLIYKIREKPDLVSCVHGICYRIVALCKYIFIVGYILNIKKY